MTANTGREYNHVECQRRRKQVLDEFVRRGVHLDVPWELYDRKIHLETPLKYAHFLMEALYRWDYKLTEEVALNTCYVRAKNRKPSHAKRPRAQKLITTKLLGEVGENVSEPLAAAQNKPRGSDQKSIQAVLTSSSADRMVFSALNYKRVRVSDRGSPELPPIPKPTPSANNLPVRPMEQSQINIMSQLKSTIDNDNHDHGLRKDPNNLNSLDNLLLSLPDDEYVMFFSENNYITLRKDMPLVDFVKSVDKVLWIPKTDRGVTFGYAPDKMKTWFHFDDDSDDMGYNKRQYQAMLEGIDNVLWISPIDQAAWFTYEEDNSGMRLVSHNPPSYRLG
jgi:hypothetical protein